MIIINSCVKFIIIKNILFPLSIFFRQTLLKEHLLLGGSHVWTRHHKTVSTLARKSDSFAGTWEETEKWGAAGSVSSGMCFPNKGLSCTPVLVSSGKFKADSDTLSL